MEIDKLKELVFEANMNLVKLNLVILTWGNVSAIDRENGIVAIKPRGIEYSDLEVDDIVCVDLSGKVLSGTLLPSVDLDIHLELYRNFSNIGAIAHTHSSMATAWAQAGMDIPACGTTHADHFFGDIPCVGFPNEYDTKNNYEENIGKIIVRDFKRRNIDPASMRAVLCEGHGPFTWGQSPAEAVEFSYILEEVAKMAKLTLELKAEIKFPYYLLEKHYTRKYGSNAYFYQTKEHK